MTSRLKERLKDHLSRKEAFLTGASRFLTRCQWMKEDMYRGTVCPWELDRGLDFQEDFHDTLEALWVWNACRKSFDTHEFDTNIALALEYAEKNAERIVFSKDAHPVTRCYDAAFILLLGLEMHGLEEYMERAADILKDTMNSLEEFTGREYRNPLWHCSNLYECGNKFDDGDAMACSLKPLEWLKGESLRGKGLKGKESLLPDYNELSHEGPGRHDFLSSWGITLYYLSTVEGDIDGNDRGEGLLQHVEQPVVDSWYRERERDEYAFNLSRCWGLGKYYNLTGEEWALEAYFDIWDRIPHDNPNSGLPRQHDFPVPESWATFFQVYAYLAVDDR